MILKKKERQWKIFIKENRWYLKKEFSQKKK